MGQFKSEWAEQTFVTQEAGMFEIVCSLCLHWKSGINSVKEVIFHFKSWLHNYEEQLLRW